MTRKQWVILNPDAWGVPFDEEFLPKIRNNELNNLAVQRKCHPATRSAPALLPHIATPLPNNCIYKGGRDMITRIRTLPFNKGGGGYDSFACFRQAYVAMEPEQVAIEVRDLRTFDTWLWKQNRWMQANPDFLGLRGYVTVTIVTYITALVKRTHLFHYKNRWFLEERNLQRWAWHICRDQNVKIGVDMLHILFDMWVMSGGGYYVPSSFAGWRKLHPINMSYWALVTIDTPIQW